MNFLVLKLKQEWLSRLRCSAWTKKRSRGHSPITAISFVALIIMGSEIQMEIANLVQIPRVFQSQLWDIFDLTSGLQFSSCKGLFTLALRHAICEKQ